LYGIKENGNNNMYDESCYKRKGKKIGKDIDNMGYMKDKVNSRGILPKTHLDNFNQIRDKRLEEALIKADAKEFISKKKKLTLDLPI
jgi:hypothetical protein